MTESPYPLPPDLPVPVDDGACDHLPKMEMPGVKLRSTRGRLIDVAEVSRGRAVFFIYPSATGRKDVPREWDLIPGARGCTGQTCAYRDRYPQFQTLGYAVHGVSAQPPEEQADFAGRFQIPYELLSDARFELTAALRLPTFEFQGRRYIKRLTLLVEGGRIQRVSYPVFPPHRDAEMVLEYLRGR